MTKQYNAAQVPVDRVRPGHTLVMSDEDGGKPWVFNVDSVGGSSKPPAPTMITLKSEPLEDGEPLVLEYPVGTIVTVLVSVTEAP